MHHGVKAYSGGRGFKVNLLFVKNFTRHWGRNQNDDPSHLLTMYCIISNGMVLSENDAEWDRGWETLSTGEFAALDGGIKSVRVSEKAGGAAKLR